jgi:hypothetical protein
MDENKGGLTAKQALLAQQNKQMNADISDLNILILALLAQQNKQMNADISDLHL